MVGDAFLKRTYHVFANLKEETNLRTTGRRQGNSEKDANIRKPFMSDFYNVTGHYMGENNGIKSCIARIQNTVNDQLESAKTLPRMIVIIADNDVVKDNLKDLYDFGATEISESLCSWLTHETEKIILGRKDAMKKIKKGSVMRAEPKIVDVKMIYRPGCDKVQALRNHFNNALENTLTKLHNHYIIDVGVSPSGFDLTNYLTADGKFEFWSNLDRQLELFDDNPSDFKPVPRALIKKKPKADTQQYRLPPPPPAHFR